MRCWGSLVGLWDLLGSGTLGVEEEVAEEISERSRVLELEEIVEVEVESKEIEEEEVEWLFVDWVVFFGFMLFVKISGIS